jgi:hypothetical protein
LGRGGRFGGKESPHWRAKLHGTVQDKPHPTCSKDRTGCTGCTGSTTPLGNLELLMKKISIQHQHQHQQHQQHERGRISGCGWTRLGRGKEASGAQPMPMSACVWYIPRGTYPKGACPIGNMNMARNTVLYCTYCTYVIRSAAQA